MTSQAPVPVFPAPWAGERCPGDPEISSIQMHQIVSPVVVLIVFNNVIWRPKFTCRCKVLRYYLEHPSQNPAGRRLTVIAFCLAQHLHISTLQCTNLHICSFSYKFAYFIAIQQNSINVLCNMRFLLIGEQPGFLPARQHSKLCKRWYSQSRDARPSVRLSVRHTPVLYQNEDSQRHNFFTV